MSKRKARVFVKKLNAKWLNKTYEADHNLIPPRYRKGGERRVGKRCDAVGQKETGEAVKSENEPLNYGVSVQPAERRVNDSR